MSEDRLTRIEKAIEDLTAAHAKTDKDIEALTASLAKTELMVNRFGRYAMVIARYHENELGDHARRILALEEIA